MTAIVCLIVDKQLLCLYQRYWHCARFVEVIRKCYMEARLLGHDVDQADST